MNGFADKKEQMQGLGLAALACLFWGTSFVAGKIAILDLGVENTIFFRLVLSALIFLFFVIRHSLIPDAKDIGWFVITGFLTLPATLYLQFEGLHKTSASHASLMIGMEPIVITMACFLFAQVKLTFRHVMAVLMAFAGVVMVTFRAEGTSTLEGDLIVIGATLLVPVWVLLSKKLIEKYPPLFFSSYITIFGTVTAFPFWLALNKTNINVTVNSLLAILFLSIVCTVLAQFIWNVGLKVLQSHEAGILLCLEPLSGVFLGVVLLDEPFNSYLLIGALLFLLQF